MTLAGAPVVITVGGDPKRARPRVQTYGTKDATFAAKPSTWLGLALLAGGAYYLWRYTQ